MCRKCGNKYDSTSLYDNKKNNESEYVIRFPDKTSLLYFEKDGIDLFSVNKKERIKICKRIINVGRDSVCEMLFDKSLNFISDLHATFILEKGDWYIRDNESVHGTYINGDKMQPKKKYRLYPDDIIDFGKSEKFLFFVSNSSKRDLELDGEHDMVNFEIKARSVNNLVGTVINNKYRLKSILSFGGMSTVFLASIDGSNKKYAVKTIDLLATGENRVINLVYAEVDLRMKLKHQYIQQVEDLVQTQQYLFIVMDYIEGETLDRMVLEKGVLQPELVVNYAKQIASVLQYMHSQNPPVIYRDIKPSNIMITDEGTIRLFDFGVVSNYGKYNDEDIEIYGTRGYAPPEQYVAKEDCRSDVFSLGMTMHYLLTGVDPCAYPYEYKSIRLYNPKLPIDLEYIIDKCTQLDPNKRYQNCEELICDLNNDNLPHA